MPMPTDVKQVRALMGGINYYRKLLPDLSNGLRPINSLLRKGVKFAFTFAMENWCEKSWRSLRLRRFWFSPIGTPLLTAHVLSTPFLSVLRRLHRRVWHRLRTGAGGRYHETHHVHQPSYALLGEALDSSCFGGRQHRLGSQMPPRLPLGNQIP